MVAKEKAFLRRIQKGELMVLERLEGARWYDLYSLKKSGYVTLKKQQAG